MHLLTEISGKEAERRKPDQRAVIRFRSKAAGLSALSGAPNGLHRRHGKYFFLAVCYTGNGSGEQAYCVVASVLGIWPDHSGSSMNPERAASVLQQTLPSNQSGRDQSWRRCHLATKRRARSIREGLRVNSPLPFTPPRHRPTPWLGYRTGADARRRMLRREEAG